MVGLLSAALVAVMLGLAKGFLLAAGVVSLVAAIIATVGLIALPILVAALALRGIWRKALLYRWLPRYVVKAEWRK